MLVRHICGARRLFLALFLLCGLVRIAHSEAPATPQEIEARLIRQPLFLRGQWAENKLKFDADGLPVKKYTVAAFTECGIDVTSVRQKGNMLRIEGQRTGLIFSENGTMKRIAITGKDYSGRITLEITGSGGSDFDQALARILALDLVSMVPQLPDYWQPYAKEHFLPHTSNATASSPTSSSGAEQVFHVGGDVKAPKPLRQVDPEFSNAARVTKASGLVRVKLSVGKDGMPFHLRIQSPAGLGLDEQAVQAVSQYRFAPATRNGIPVTVDLEIEVNFQIF